jgi:hypothetical protein
MAKCILCSKKLLTKNSNTKGLWVHLKSMHPVNNMELEKLVSDKKVQKSKEIELVKGRVR